MQSTIATFSSQAFIHLKHEINFTVLINFIFFLLLFLRHEKEVANSVTKTYHKPLLLQIS